MLLYFSVCRLSDLSELVKCCPHHIQWVLSVFTMKLETLRAMPRLRDPNTSWYSRWSAAREVGWKMGREEINKKRSWKYFLRIFPYVSQICSLLNAFIPRDLEKYFVLFNPCPCAPCMSSASACDEYCRSHPWLMTRVCWETCQNSGHVKWQR